jgi:apolipoprotein N-acyltransferase
LNAWAGAAACAVAGAVCALAFAPYDLPLLAPVSLTVLFHFWSQATPRQAFRFGYLFGIGLFGAGVNWLHISLNLFGGLGLLAASGVTFLLIAYLALFPALTGYAAQRLATPTPALNLLLTLPALWVLSEWLRTWLFTGFPWMHLGYSQIDSILGDLAPLAGVFGISWAVALVAGGVLMLLRAGMRDKMLAAGCLLLVLAGGWLTGRASWTHDMGNTRSVALVQGAVPLEIKWRIESLHQSVERYINLTAPHWGTNIIVWPETAIPAFASQVPDLLRQLTAEAQRGDSDLYVGFPTLDNRNERYFNSLLLLGAEPQTYDKRHLVPFGEFTPLAFILGRFARLLNIPMSNFNPGNQAQPLLRGRHGISGVSICYEDAFGEEVIQALPAAGLLINVSNDGWFGDSAAPHQHLQMARMRARETGRYLLRATNSGVSAIIDPRGRVRAQAPQFLPVVLTGTITLFDGLTPYARFGNWPVVTIAICLILLARRARVPAGTTASR